MVRVVEETRWSADLVLGVIGTPMKPVPGQDPTHDDAWVEATENPQEMIDMDVGVTAPETPKDADLKTRAIQRIRLTKNDFKNYGYTDECPKCVEMKAGNHFQYDIIQRCADTAFTPSSRNTMIQSGVKYRRS